MAPFLRGLFKHWVTHKAWAGKRDSNLSCHHTVLRAHMAELTPRIEGVLEGALDIRAFSSGRSRGHCSKTCGNQGVDVLSAGLSLGKKCAPLYLNLPNILSVSEGFLPLVRERDKSSAGLWLSPLLHILWWWQEILPVISHSRKEKATRSCWHAPILLFEAVWALKWPSLQGKSSTNSSFTHWEMHPYSTPLAF